MWTKLQNTPRKKAPRKVAVIDPNSCFGAFACSICQAACPVEDCITMERVAPGEVDKRTGKVVEEDYANWTMHPNNPGACAAE